MRVIPKRFFKTAILLIVLGLGLAACGSDSEPFIMEVASTIFVGANPINSPLSFIVDPEQQNPTGTLEAQIIRDFNDHTEFNVLSFDLVSTFDGVGTIQMVLDPNIPSQMSVAKLNCNDKPEGSNVLNLSLIIETPEQNLTLSNLVLESDSALLELTENLPPLGFTVDGQSFAIQVSVLNVQIPSELIVSDCDPQ